MDLRKIKKLIDLLEESNLAEIEIKEGEESVRLARVPKGGIAMSLPPRVVLVHRRTELEALVERHGTRGRDFRVFIVARKPD